MSVSGAILELLLPLCLPCFEFFVFLIGSLSFRHLPFFPFLIEIDVAAMTFFVDFVLAFDDEAFWFDFDLFFYWALILESTGYFGLLTLAVILDFLESSGACLSASWSWHIFNGFLTMLALESLLALFYGSIDFDGFLYDTFRFCDEP